MYNIPTPLGDLFAVFDPHGALTYLKFVPPATVAGSQLDDCQADAARLLTIEMDAYFSGQLREFSVPIAPKGTVFQHRVWDHLLTIPYGQTATYGQVARALGSMGHSRAVGRANGTNPIFLIIPCHRVIGADGRLTGYAGGLDKKAELLKLEKQFSCT